MSYDHLVIEFEKNGFVVLEDVFSSPEITAVSNEVDHVIEGKSSKLPETEIVYEPDSSPRRVRNAFRLHIYDKQFFETAKHPNFWSSEAILGKSLRLYGSQVFAKPAVWNRRAGASGHAVLAIRAL